MISYRQRVIGSCQNAQLSSCIARDKQIGTPGYMAPEAFFRNFGGYSAKSDVFSAGIVLYAMYVALAAAFSCGIGSPVHFRSAGRTPSKSLKRTKPATFSLNLRLWRDSRRS